MTVLEVKYRNIALRVELDGVRSAALFINNIKRMQDTLTTRPGTLRLSSSVQTDYEWHEFIEAILTFTEKEIGISLRASNSEIAGETYPVQIDDDQ